MRPAPDAASLHQALHKLLEEIGTDLEEGSMSFGPINNDCRMDLWIEKDRLLMARKKNLGLQQKPN